DRALAAALDVQLGDGVRLAQGYPCLDRRGVDDDALLHFSPPPSRRQNSHHGGRAPVRRKDRLRTEQFRGAARHGVQASPEPTRVARSSCSRTLSNGYSKSKTLAAALTCLGRHR